MANSNVKGGRMDVGDGLFGGDTDGTSGVEKVALFFISVSFGKIKEWNGIVGLPRQARQGVDLVEPTNVLRAYPKTPAAR